ncbi:MAG: DUF58 domain-containing protein [Dehalococcoidia bacterium]
MIRRPLRWCLAPGHRSLVVILAILVGSSFIAFGTGFWLLFRLSYVIALGVPISFLLAWYSSRGLEVRIERRSIRAQVGQEAQEVIEVRNRGVLPRLWMEVEDPSEMPGHHARRVVIVPPRGLRNWVVDTPLTRRGVFSWGPATVRTTDPFGVFRRERRFGGKEEILVFPEVVDLPHFEVPPASLPGEGRFRRRTHQVTPNASGVRDYAPGDSFNRIHWKTTARAGRPMVKTFELDPASDIWVVLDLEGRVQAGSGDESTEEYGVRVAASVVRHYLVQNRSVGLISFGEDLDIVEPERGPQHLTRMLESLATARAIGEAPLGNILLEEQRRFGRHTTLILVTASTDDEWLGQVLALTQRGVRIAVVLLDAGSFGSRRTPLLMFGELTASDIMTYVVGRGDDLSVALGPGKGASARAASWQA